MNSREVLGWCCLVLCMVAGFLPGAHAEPLNRVVAVVNNEVITLHELNKKIKEVTGRDTADLRGRNEELFLDTREKVLQLMIDERIAEEKIRELGIKVTEREVEATVERIKKENRWTQEDLLDMLKNEGMTYEKFLEKVRKDLQRMQLINAEVKSKIIITEDRVKRYYDQHKEDYTGETRVHLAGIFLVRKDPKQTDEIQELTRKGEEILTKLRGGDDFGTLAKKYSDGPGADEGGDLGTFKTTQLEPELRSVVQGLTVGGTSDLIMRPNGIQIIKLLSREGGEGRSFEEVRASIYSKLYAEEVNERYSSWIRQLREKSYTKITF
ncbi:MAG: SurA N-terminal domain-containing protein [Deltaproteobacteria bacterium]|nr:SurA N-terminal domain-containing protein [Deltaproteobacteria bacterium]